MSLRFHIKLLGFIYTALASIVAFFALLGLIIHASQGKLSQAAVVVPILAGLATWWLQTGLGLLSYRRSVRLHAILQAVIIMVGLNSLLLLAGGPPFSSSSVWIAFHVVCISVGVYTLVVMLLPGITEALQ